MKYVTLSSPHEFVLTGYVMDGKRGKQYVEIQHKQNIFWMDMVEFVRLVFTEWRGDD